MKNLLKYVLFTRKGVVALISLFLKQSKRKYHEGI